MPLDANLKGCWRYRIGDWRLVYRPDPRERTVVLLDFAPRDGIYT
jgi:mRNA-degrading endonuclease RelE of RelBE toxin-antitoxin system